MSSNDRDVSLRGAASLLSLGSPMANCDGSSVLNLTCNASNSLLMPPFSKTMPYRAVEDYTYGRTPILNTTTPSSFFEYPDALNFDTTMTPFGGLGIYPNVGPDNLSWGAAQVVPSIYPNMQQESESIHSDKFESFALKWEITSVLPRLNPNIEQQISICCGDSVSKSSDGSNNGIVAYCKTDYSLYHPKDDKYANLRSILYNNIQLSLGRDFLGPDEEKSRWERRWCWHKTWVLPALHVYLNSQFMDSFPRHTKFYAAVFCICPQSLFSSTDRKDNYSGNCAGDNGDSMEKNNNDGPILSSKLSGVLDLGLDGPNVMSFIGGKASIHGLRFRTTSAKQNGRQLHLLTTVFVDLQPFISLLSEGIWVDSRAMASKGSTRSKHEVVPINPFPCELFTQGFLKKARVDEQGACIDLAIENSVEGLSRYLTAPNIRHKCRHPVFLAVRFSEAVAIARNMKDFPSTALTSDIFNSLLNAIYVTRAPESPVQKDNASFVPAFALVIREAGSKEGSPSSIKKICDSLVMIRRPSFGFFESDNLLPKSFKIIDDVNALRTMYSSVLLEQKLNTQTALEPSTATGDSSSDDKGNNNTRNIVGIKRPMEDSNRYGLTLIAPGKKEMPTHFVGKRESTHSPFFHSPIATNLSPIANNMQLTFPSSPSQSRLPYVHIPISGEAEVDYNALFSLVPTPCFVLNPQAIVIECNVEFCRTLDVGRVDILWQSLFNIVHNEDTEMFGGMLNRLIYNVRNSNELRRSMIKCRFLYGRCRWITVDVCLSCVPPATQVVIAIADVGRDVFAAAIYGSLSMPSTLGDTVGNWGKAVTPI